MVVDGKEGKEYEDIGPPVFSPDGKHLAYAAVRGGSNLIVVDGVEGATCDQVGGGTLVFSPDGKRFAYGARTGAKWSVVVDGKSQGSYDKLGAATFHVTPDGKRLVYAAHSSGKWFIAVDGKEGRPCDGILGTNIFLDGAEGLHYIAVKGKGIYAVEEKME